MDLKDEWLLPAQATPPPSLQTHFHSDQCSFEMQLGFCFYPVIFVPPRFNLDEEEQRPGVFVLCSINGACSSAVSPQPSCASKPPSLEGSGKGEVVLAWMEWAALAVTQPKTNPFLGVPLPRELVFTICLFLFWAGGCYERDFKILVSMV